MPDARPQTPPVVLDTAPVVPRRIPCSHCNAVTLVFEIPCPYLDVTTYICGGCRDTHALEAAVEVEAQNRRDSMFALPPSVVPYNQLPAGY